MSADTFGWICKLKDWYRICFWQAPDNLCIEKWYETYVAEYFWWSKTYDTKEEAIIALDDVYKEIEKECDCDWYPFINEYWTLYFCFNELTTDEIDEIENREYETFLKNL